MKREIIHIDKNTGEELQGTPFFAPSKQNYSYKGWMAMNLEAEEFFATHIKSIDDFRVLSALKARLDYDNYLAISQTEIAQKLGMKQPNVSRSIKRLIEMTIIKKGPSVGKSVTYVFNPQMGYRGKARSQIKAVSNHLGWSVVQGGKA